MKKLRVVLTAALTVAVLGLVAPQTEAADIVMVDGNSSVTIDPDFGGGMYNWVVDGTDHLFQQWFWYRYNAMTDEESIENLGNKVVVGPFALGPNQVTNIDYNDGTLGVNVTYMLAGGTAGSGSSLVNEVITLTNMTAAPMSLVFFQYSDFDLEGITDQFDDSVVISPGNTLASQSDADGPTIAEAVSLPLPFLGEANTTTSLNPTLPKFSDGLPTNLDGNLGPVTGDVTWAFQWNFIIPAGGSTSLSKEKTIGQAAVPEPASLVLFGMSLIGVAGAARRRFALTRPQA